MPSQWERLEKIPPGLVRPEDPGTLDLEVLDRALNTETNLDNTCFPIIVPYAPDIWHPTRVNDLPDEKENTPELQVIAKIGAISIYWDHLHAKLISGQMSLSRLKLFSLMPVFIDSENSAQVLVGDLRRYTNVSDEENPYYIYCSNWGGAGDFWGSVNFTLIPFRIKIDGQQYTLPEGAFGINDSLALPAWQAWVKISQAALSLEKEAIPKIASNSLVSLNSKKIIDAYLLINGNPMLFQLRNWIRRQGQTLFPGVSDHFTAYLALQNEIYDAIDLYSRDYPAGQRLAREIISAVRDTAHHLSAMYDQAKKYLPAGVYTQIY